MCWYLVDPVACSSDLLVVDTEPWEVGWIIQLLWTQVEVNKIQLL
jgi:hypothetical protein